jgi:NCAIR mutase (PurE)-related protein
MTRDRVLEILQQVAAGNSSAEAALDELAWLPVEPLRADAAPAEFARVDHHRSLRTGQPEVVFGAGKTVPQILAICERLAHHNQSFLATRVEPEAQTVLLERFPQAEVNSIGRVVHLAAAPARVDPRYGKVLIACAGTSDLPVAEEAAATARAFANPVERLYDVGVAGLHRLLEHTSLLRDAAVLIVVAGMEGALASVVGGLVRVPVIAVPTSVGYGASFGGIAALLAMLNSCAPGITVVNIDNGFGAAFAATRINQLLAANI